MHRPIGVTILAILAGLAGIAELWRAAVFMGWVNWTFLGKEVSYPDPQWGQVLWALIIAGIWFWVAAGFWNVRAYAWSFGIFIAIFTFIYGFMALLFGSSMEAESIPWLFAIIIFFYLNYPGVRDAFVQHEMSMLTPEQRAAMEQMAKANAAAMTANAAAAAPAPAPAPTTPTAPPAPPAPPSDGGASA